MRAAEFVQSYFDAWNHSDARAVAEHLDRNGTYCDIPTHEQHSRDDLAANLTDFFALEHHLYQLNGEVLANDRSIAFQYKMSPLDQDGEESYGAEFMTLDGEGVVRITDYYELIHSTRPHGNNGHVTQKYAKSGLDERQLESYRGRLLDLMEKDNVYLQPDLTMPKLASMVNCSVNHLSQAVNSGFGMSFFDFLNNYRIEASKHLLGAHETQEQAILDISFSIGFNSNSAFYAAFKKATGQTPAQYRKDRLKKR